MDISKSSRHSKIAGDFGESLVLYWLSKFGFESARVDHTGIDLIARNPHTGEVMGISVKSRTRVRGTEQDSITIPSDSFEKAALACKAFGCVPYFAVVVDAAEVIRVFLLRMDHLLKICPVKQRGAYWKVSGKHLDQYMNDPEVKIFELCTSTKSWWKNL
ncbi:MAG: hypothetical protein ABIL68_05015 [bacterium]